MNNKFLKQLQEMTDVDFDFNNIGHLDPADDIPGTSRTCLGWLNNLNFLIEQWKIPGRCDLRDYFRVGDYPSCVKRVVRENFRDPRDF